MNRWSHALAIPKKTLKNGQSLLKNQQWLSRLMSIIWFFFEKLRTMVISRAWVFEFFWEPWFWIQNTPWLSLGVGQSFFFPPFVLFLLVAFLTFFSCCFCILMLGVGIVDSCCCLSLGVSATTSCGCYSFAFVVVSLRCHSFALVLLLFHVGVVVPCWCCVFALMLLFSIGVVTSRVGATTLHWCCIFTLVLHLCIGPTPLRIGVASSCWCYYSVHWCYFQVLFGPNTVVVVFALVMLLFI